jgi:cytidylate kinase
LQPADDAVVVDTGELTIDEVVASVLAVVASLKGL